MQTHILSISNLCMDNHFDFEDYDGAFGLASFVKEKYLQARQPPPATRARPPVAPIVAIAPVAARDLAASVVPTAATFPDIIFDAAAANPPKPPSQKLFYP